MNGTGTQVVKSLVDFNTMSDTAEDAARRVIALLRDLPPAAGSEPAPGLDWTVAEVAAHLITIFGRGLGDMRRGDTLQGMHDLNAQGLTEIETRDLRAIAERLEAQAGEFVELRPLFHGDEPFPLHAGVIAELAAALSYLVWELLVHGFDIASGAQRQWEIPQQSAARALRAGLPAIQPWVRPDVLDGQQQHLVVAFGDEEPALALTVGMGDYRVELAPASQADGSVDPAHALLAISRRQPPAQPLVERLASLYLPI